MSLATKGGENMASLGLNIKALREGHGLAREELSRRTGITMQTIYRLESGEQENPKLDTLEKLANGLGVTVSDLLANSETTVKHNNAS